MSFSGARTPERGYKRDLKRGHSTLLKEVVVASLRIRKHLSQESGFAEILSVEQRAPITRPHYRIHLPKCGTDYLNIRCTRLTGHHLCTKYYKYSNLTFQSKQSPPALRLLRRLLGGLWQRMPGNCCGSFS